MKKGFTNIVILLDQSGSMSSIKNDMEGSLNSFIEEQKKVPGEATVTLYTFPYLTGLNSITRGPIIKNGTDVSWRDKTINKKFSEKLEVCPRIEISPSGGTPLYDAISESIDDVGAQLSSLQESERPESTVFLIITDGEENASNFATSKSVAEKINHQKDVYKWQFVYLGANQDAFKAGGAFGLGTTSANYAATKSGIQTMSCGLTSYMTGLRSAVNPQDVSFNPESFAEKKS